jgi:hypothetical protein
VISDRSAKTQDFYFPLWVCALGLGVLACGNRLLSPCNRLLGPKIDSTRQDAETYNAARDQS